MAHSRRRHVTWMFVGIEILLFASAVLSTYLSATINWSWFWVLAVFALVAFTVVRIAEAVPQVQDLLAFEDAAAKMTKSAMTYGVQRFYNMQQPEDQSARNADALAEIENADAMWLCANSGASYLDPGVYRHWPAVETKLNQGAPFKVVLLDPLSQAKAFRNRLNIGEEAIDSKVNLPNLVRLYNQYPNLDIRFVEHGMHATVFSTPSCLFYDPYHVGVVGHRIENRSFCLKIARSEPNDGVGYYGLLKSHFDSLWRASQDIESWMDSKVDLLPRPLPDLQRRYEVRQADV